MTADEYRQAALNRSLDEGVRNEALNGVRTASDVDDAIGVCALIANDAGETERMRSFAVQHLSVVLTHAGADQRSRITPVLLPLLGSRTAPTSVRRDALLALGRDPSLKHIGTVRDVCVQAIATNDRDLLSVALRVAAEQRWADLAEAAQRYVEDPDPVIRGDAARLAQVTWKDGHGDDH